MRKIIGPNGFTMTGLVQLRRRRSRPAKRPNYFHKAINNSYPRLRMTKAN